MLLFQMLFSSVLTGSIYLVFQNKDWEILCAFLKSSLCVNLLHIVFKLSSIRNVYDSLWYKPLRAPFSSRVAEFYTFKEIVSDW